MRESILRWRSEEQQALILNSLRRRMVKRRSRALRRLQRGHLAFGRLLKTTCMWLMFQWSLLQAPMASIPCWILQVAVAWEIWSGMVSIGSIMLAPSPRNRWTSNASWSLTLFLCLFLEVMGQVRSLLVFGVQSLFWWSCKLVLCFL